MAERTKQQQRPPLPESPTFQGQTAIDGESNNGQPVIRRRRLSLVEALNNGSIEIPQVGVEYAKNGLKKKAIGISHYYQQLFLFASLF